MHMNPVSISISSFGADLVRQRGHTAFVSLVAAAGATRIELREELFTDELSTDNALPTLAKAIHDQGLQCLYSAPLELWLEGQSQPNPALADTLLRARACDAQWLKVSLGHFSPTCDFQALASCLAQHDVQLLVENDQTVQGGRIEPFCAFFSQVQALGLDIAMTFDVGNWQWQGQSALKAAEQLGGYVQYVHFKAVMGDAHTKLIARPPEPSDLETWQHLLSYLPAAVPRAIEYPLQGDDLLEVTRQQVALLARLAPSSTTLDKAVASHV
jgi:sugar phosphate isomerase/epimerase